MITLTVESSAHAPTPRAARRALSPFAEAEWPKAVSARSLTFAVFSLLFRYYPLQTSTRPSKASASLRSWALAARSALSPMLAAGSNAAFGVEVLLLGAAAGFVLIAWLWVVIEVSRERARCAEKVG